MKLIKTKLNNRGFSHLELGLLVIVVVAIAFVGYGAWGHNSPAVTVHAGGYTPLGKGYMCSPTPTNPICSASHYTSTYNGFACRITTTNSTGAHYWVKGYATITSGSDFPVQTSAQILFYKGPAESDQQYLMVLPQIPSFSQASSNKISVSYQPVDQVLSKYKIPLGSIYIRFAMQSITDNFTLLPTPLNATYDQYIKLVPC